MIVGDVAHFLEARKDFRRRLTQLQQRKKLDLVSSFPEPRWCLRRRAAKMGEPFRPSKGNPRCTVDKRTVF
jgi:hypothetical protein